MVKPTERSPNDSRKRVVTGVAISSTELCAADLRLRGAADRAWRATLEPLSGEGVAWPSLTAALADLARAIGVEGGTLAIALMPPLTEVRRLELPPLKEEELHTLLARNAGRYFVNARGAQIVGAFPAAKRTKGAPVPIVAAAASTRLVAAIRGAAEQSGWTVQSVAPAESAWAAAATALWPAFAKRNAWAAITQPDRTDLLQLEHGRLVAVRRFRGGVADSAVIADTVGTTATVGLAGEATSRRQLSAALSDRRVSVSTPSGEWAHTGESSELLAAHFTGRETGPALRSEDAVTVAKRRDQRKALTIAAIAAGILIAAAGIELWGVHHKLDQVRAERERLRPQIASTMVGRTTVDATARSLVSLNGIDRSAPQWAAVITTLSQAITDDAYLTAIRARGDSLIIDGLAEHASRVFDALQRTRVLADVKSAAPVRREIQDDGTALDHFTISARVLAPDAVPPVATPTASPRPGGSAR
jgi:hypothetical protein